MVQKTLNHKSGISQLREELGLLRSFVIGIIGKDEEGEYRPEFVEKILRTIKIKPKYAFRDRKSFITRLAHPRRNL